MSEKMLDMLFQQCCDVIVYKDFNLKYISSNINMKYPNIIKNSNIKGKTAYDILPFEVADIINQNDVKVLKKLKAVKYKIEFSKDAVFEIISAPVIEGNSLNGIISIGRDITLDTKTKEQKDSFVATLTHDLKTPTIAQIRMIELLLNGSFGKTSIEQEEMLTQILKSCKYMQQMISYVLNTYKFENGNKKLNNEDFDFIELIKECCNELSSLNIDKNLKFITKFDVKNAMTNGDRAQLKRVIVNMVSNAVSYAFSDTEIEIALTDDKNNLIFYTINKSLYMPKNTLNSIFHKYVSGNIGVKFNKTGTGLGLYLSEQIISAHNGTVFAESFAENKNKIGFKIPKINKESIISF